MTSDIGGAGLQDDDDIDFTGTITFTSAPTISGNALLKANDNISLLNNNSGFITNTANAFSYSNLSGTPTIPSNNNQLTNGAGYVTSSVIDSLNASNLSSGTIPDARFPSVLPAIDGSALTGMASTDNVRTGILDVAGISTFRNDALVGSGITLSPDGDIFTTGVTTSTTFVGNLTGSNHL